jgi:RNA polymerase sigma factor (sigma-70 family)
MRKANSGSVVEPLHTLRVGTGEQITRLYDRYRGEFLAFAAKYYSLFGDDAVEVYQDSFVALYENVRSGRLATLSVSLKTYLFRIAQNKMLNRRRGAAGKSDPLPDNLAEESGDWQQKQEITYDLVQRMEEPCNKVLTLYYWERLSMDAIAGEMNYANAQVAKNRKSVCMRKLKDVLTRRFVTEGLM